MILIKKTFFYQYHFYPIKIDHTNNRIDKGNNVTHQFYEAAISMYEPHQLSYRNLSPAQRLAVMDKFK